MRDGCSRDGIELKKHGAVLALFLLLLEGLVLPITLPSVSNAQAPLVRMSVFTDKYVYSPQDTVVVTVKMTNLLAASLSGLTINSTIFDSNALKAMSLPIVNDASLDALGTGEFNVSSPISLHDANYLIVSNVFANNTQIGSTNVPLVVLDTAGRAPLTLALVFHMHQPIYLNLQGQFEQPWVQVHSGSDIEYNGTWYGAYYWHVYMLETHPGIKVTFNLQPSLLYQWNMTMYDFKYNGTYPGGQAELSRDLAAVNATVAGYRMLAADGQAEILTSPFYHPLSAILLKLGWSSDFLAQTEMGKNYTKVFVGTNPQGMWTPEMGFTMGMVPIMQEAGIKYTVLDGDNHFAHASGPSARASIYQPFELDGANGSHIDVFFRDTRISEELTSTWNRIAEPRVAASDFIAAVADVYRSSPGGVITIASDGENPIAQASGLISALDFDAIYGAIQSQAWLQTSTLGSILASHPPTAKLTSVPDGSWSGGFGLWIGVQPKTAIWEAIAKARTTLVNLTARYGASDPEIKKLWNYLYVAEGSDWEWQTPQGPAWFAMQGYRYANAATEYQAAPAQPPSLWPWYLTAACGAALLAAVWLVLARRKRP